MKRLDGVEDSEVATSDTGDAGVQDDEKEDGVSEAPLKNEEDQQYLIGQESVHLSRAARTLLAFLASGEERPRSSA